MAVLQLNTIATLLDAMDLTEGDFIASSDDPVTIARLLKLQRQLDRLQSLIARFEERMFRKLTPPHLSLTLANHSVVQVHTPAEIDALITDVQISSRVRERLLAELATRISEHLAAADAYRPTSLPRHELRLGRKLGQILTAYLRSPPEDLAGLRTRLVLLVATLEPGLAAECLTEILTSSSLRLQA